MQSNANDSEAATVYHKKCAHYKIINTSNNSSNQPKVETIDLFYMDPECGVSD